VNDCEDTHGWIKDERYFAQKDFDLPQQATP